MLDSFLGAGIAQSVVCGARCHRGVIDGNKNTSSMPHPRRQNVTTYMIGLKKKRRGREGEGGSNRQKSHQKHVEPPEIQLGTQEKKKKKKKKLFCQLPCR